MGLIDTVAVAMSTQEWGVTEVQGRTLYDFILREKPERILELGSGIGTSACYMAAALSELGQGKITSIDRNPDLPSWIAKTFAKVPPHLSKHHELIISKTSYNDEMLRIIERQTKNNVCEPIFDFVFIDGSHTWSVDGLAFYLSEKLLKPNRWMLFDDLHWTVGASAEAIKNGMATGTELDNTTQVLKIFTLLVAQHPRFHQCRIDGDWGWAFKRDATQGLPSGIRIVRPSITRRIASRLSYAVNLIRSGITNSGTKP